MTMTDDKLREELIGMGYDEGAVDEMMRHEEGTSSSSAPAQSCGALEWRSEPPSEEGHYWCRRVTEEVNGGAFIRRVRDMQGEYMMHDGNAWWSVKDLEGHQWAGPIPEPSEA